jgi:hypothetical protein
LGSMRVQDVAWAGISNLLQLHYYLASPECEYLYTVGSPR